MAQVGPLLVANEYLILAVLDIVSVPIYRSLYRISHLISYKSMRGRCNPLIVCKVIQQQFQEVARYLRARYVSNFRPRSLLFV